MKSVVSLASFAKLPVPLRRSPSKLKNAPMAQEEQLDTISTWLNASTADFVWRPVQVIQTSHYLTFLVEIEKWPDRLFQEFFTLRDPEWPPSFSWRFLDHRNFIINRKFSRCYRRRAKFWVFNWDSWGASLQQGKTSDERRQVGARTRC